MITPTFHYDILKDFMPVFNQKSKILVKVLEAKAESGEVIDMYPYITLCGLDIICKSAMGKHVNAILDKDCEYVQSVYR